MENAKKPKFIQITSAEAYYKSASGFPLKHFTLFALDEEGNIWTRYFDGTNNTYREWYKLGTQGLK